MTNIYLSMVLGAGKKPIYKWQTTKDKAREYVTIPREYDISRGFWQDYMDFHAASTESKWPVH